MATPNRLNATDKLKNSEFEEAQTHNLKGLVQKGTTFLEASLNRWEKKKILKSCVSTRTNNCQKVIGDGCGSLHQQLLPFSEQKTAEVTDQDERNEG